MKKNEMTSTFNHLSSREAWLEAVVRGIDKCILVMDTDGYLLFINDKATQVLNLNADDVLERRLDSFLTLWDEENQTKQPFLLHAVNALGHPITSEEAEVFLCENGAKMRAKYRLAPLRHEDGHILGILLSFTLEIKQASDSENSTVNVGPQQAFDDQKKAIYVRSGGKYLRVWLDDLLWIEAMENYIQLQVGKERIIVHSTLKNILKMLENRGYIRIHRSIVVKESAIESIEENLVLIQGNHLTIGKSFKAGLLESLNLL